MLAHRRNDHFGLHDDDRIHMAYGQFLHDQKHGYHKDLHNVVHKYRSSILLDVEHKNQNGILHERN